MGKWLDLNLTHDETIAHMVSLGIREGLAETILLIEQGKITGDIVEDSRPPEALERLYSKSASAK